MLSDYHLGLLSPEEAEEVRRHLAECADCREELEEISRVFDLLPFGVPPASPPAALKERVLAHALGAASAEARDRDADRGAPPAAPRPERREPARLADRRRSWLTPLAAAASLLVIGFFTWAFLDLREENRQLQAEIQELQQADEQRAQQDGSLLVVAVEGTGRAPDARGTAVVDPGEGNLALDVYNLPAPPEGHSYRAWLVGADGEAVALGPMELNERGDGRMTGEVSEPLQSFETVEITTEPLGAEDRSGPVYLEAKL
jgi:anti-sigma-K factor RskA